MREDTNHIPNKNMDTIIPMGGTIREWQQHFDRLYGRRNHFVNGSFERRALHLNRRIGRIADADRKGERMEGRIARAVSYFMSCVNCFGPHLDLQLGMMEKFPITGCLYCGFKPCGCTESRPDPQTYVVHEEQASWTVSRWQQHLKDLYGHFNEGKFDKVFKRLVSENGEFGILLAEGPNTPIDPEEMMTECRREAADVFSWLLTIGYVTGIDVERAVIDRYEICPGCKRSSNCSCSLVFVSKDGRRFSRVGTPDYTKAQQ